MGSTDMVRPEGAELDPGKVAESVVMRGDLSALNPAERAKFYVQMCESLGLNPASQPFAYLRLNGKEVLYATRGATDQLARLHRVTREIVRGPEVIDLAGAKLVLTVCRATLPDGRHETATATCKLQDACGAENVLMKSETKAKRRATLSILGLGILDETELETIPEIARGDARTRGPRLTAVDAPPPRPEVEREIQRVERAAETLPDEDPEREAIEMPAALQDFYGRIAEIELPGEAVAVWIKHRAELASLPGNHRETAWKALCKRTEDVGRMKNAKVWLKRAIADEDARRPQGAQVQPSDGGAA